MAYDYRRNINWQEMSTQPTAHRAWPAGVLAATGTLIALGFVTIGFYASGGGLMIAGTLAIGVGSIVGAIVDPPHGARHVAIVAFYVVAVAVCYVLVLQNLARSTSIGVTSGAGAELPRRGGGPGVYPPSR